MQKKKYLLQSLNLHLHTLVCPTVQKVCAVLYSYRKPALCDGTKVSKHMDALFV